MLDIESLFIIAIILSMCIAWIFSISIIHYLYKRKHKEEWKRRINLFVLTLVGFLPFFPSLPSDKKVFYFLLLLIIINGLSYIPYKKAIETFERIKFATSFIILLISILYFLIIFFVSYGVINQKEEHHLSEFTIIAIDDNEITAIRKEESLYYHQIPIKYYLGTQYEKVDDAIYLKDYETMSNRSLTDVERGEGTWGKETRLTDEIIDVEYEVVFTGDFKNVKYVYHKDELIWSKDESKCGDSEIQTRCIQGLPESEREG